MRLIRDFLFLLYIFTSQVSADSNSLTDKYTVIWDNLVAVVSAKHFLAIKSAYDDLSNKLKPSLLRNSSSDTLAGYAADITNYNIYIREGNLGIDVYFKLRQTERFHPKMGSEGTYRYIIDPVSYAIILRDWQK